MPFQQGQSGNPARMFTKVNQPANNGRPAKIYTILKRSGYSKDDIRTAFEEIGWQTLGDLKKVYENENSPALLRLVANSFRKGIEKGDFRYISEILQHVIGKPKETVEATITQFKITLNLDGSNTGDTIRPAPALSLPEGNP